MNTVPETIHAPAPSLRADLVAAVRGTNADYTRIPLKRAVLLLAVATIVALTPAARSPAWQHSVGAQWLAVTVQGLRPMLPPAITQWFPKTGQPV